MLYPRFDVSLTVFKIRTQCDIDETIEGQIDGSFINISLPKRYKSKELLICI